MILNYFNLEWAPGDKQAAMALRQAPTYNTRQASFLFLKKHLMQKVENLYKFLHFNPNFNYCNIGTHLNTFSINFRVTIRVFTT